MNNEIDIIIYHTGFVEIYWSHNGWLTKRYNSVKRVPGFLKTALGGRRSTGHPVVHKTVWVTTPYADKAEAQVKRELMASQREIEMRNKAAQVRRLTNPELVKDSVIGRKPANPIDVKQWAQHSAHVVGTPVIEAILALVAERDELQAKLS